MQPNGSAAETIDLARRIISSRERFLPLFQEGMALIEEVAAYLDGPGRKEARSGSSLQTMAYAKTSMMMTTTLMRLASWLLLHRAVLNEEMDDTEVEKQLDRTQLHCDKLEVEPLLCEVPEGLRELINRTLSMKTRIVMLDRALYGSGKSGHDNAVLSSLSELQRAFATASS